MLDDWGSEWVDMLILILMASQDESVTTMLCIGRASLHSNHPIRAAVKCLKYMRAETKTTWIYLKCSADVHWVQPLKNVVYLRGLVQMQGSGKFQYV